MMLSFIFKSAREASIRETIENLEDLRKRVEPDTARSLGHCIGSVKFADYSIYGHEYSQHCQNLVSRIFDFSVAPEKRVALYTEYSQSPATDLIPGGKLERTYPQLYPVMVFINRRDIVNAVIDICRQSNNAREADQLYNIIERGMRNKRDFKPVQSLIKAYFPDEGPIQPTLTGMEFAPL